MDFAAEVDFYEEESMAFAAEVDFYEEESMAFAAEVDCYKDESVALTRGLIRRCFAFSIGRNRA